MDREPMLTYEFFNLVQGWVAEFFGPFDPRVVITAIRPSEKNWPFTSYPPPYNQFLVTINLPSKDTEDWMLLRHLAHELVHCLTPNGPPTGQATVLEEGLAEHSSIYLLEREVSVTGFQWRDQLGGPYLAAFNLVEEVVAHEGLEGMRDEIRRMRAETRLPFAKITADLLSNYLPNTPRPVLEALSQRFS